MPLHTSSLILLLALLGCQTTKRESAPPVVNSAGTYSTMCFTSGQGAERRSLIFGSNTLTFVQAVFTDTSCRSPVAKVSEVYTVDRRSGPDTNIELDLNLLRVEAVVQTAEGVIATNRDKVGGYTDWVINAPKDVTGKPQTSTANFKSQGKKYYNFISIVAQSLRKDDGTTVDALFLGSTDNNLDGSTPAKRPQQLAIVAFSKE